MRARFLALLVGGVLGVALVAGCGGSSGNDGTEVTVSSLSKAEFISRADEACTKRQDEARADFIAYGEQASKPNESAAEGEAHIITVAETIVVPSLQQEVEDIKALGAPRGSEGEVEAMLQAIERGVEKAESHPKQVIEESAKLLEPAGKIARKLGLKVCGSG